MTSAADGPPHDPDHDVDGARTVPAPGLRETADVWFDTGRDPVVSWDRAGRRWWLTDPLDPALRLALLTLPRAADDPVHVAMVLADGLAACDFPPTADGADPDHVAAALRAAGVTV